MRNYSGFAWFLTKIFGERVLSTKPRLPKVAAFTVRNLTRGMFRSSFWLGVEQRAVSPFKFEHPAITHARNIQDAGLELCRSVGALIE